LWQDIGGGIVAASTLGDDVVSAASEPSPDDDQRALLNAVVDVVRSSQAMEQGRVAAEETRVALLSMFQARLPARAEEIDAFLMAEAGPESARVQTFAESMAEHMAGLLVANFTLDELLDFEAFQKTDEFQEMAGEFARELQRPLRTFQDVLIQDVNERFC